jgi:hypothetical protein
MTTIASTPPWAKTPLLQVDDLRKEFKISLGFRKAGIVPARAAYRLTVCPSVASRNLLELGGCLRQGELIII